MISFGCSACGSKLKTKDDAAGKNGKCPKCGKKQKVPTPARKQTDIGNTEPICPYCNHELDKMPGRKKKCPDCGQHMLVRTRPSDRKKILIREDQVIEVEELWAIEQGTHDQFIAKRKEREAVRGRLRKRFGHEPSEADIEWSLRNDELLEHMSQNDWGLYRNTRLSMGDILNRERRYLGALDTYLEVCYFDLNGATNAISPEMKKECPELEKEYPPFDPKLVFLAPGVLGYIEAMLECLELTKNEARDRFIKIAAKLHRSLKMPIDPDTAWDELSKELE